MANNFMGSNVSFHPDADKEMEIQRRMKLADALQGQGMQPLPAQRVPYHPLQGLAKLANAYVGKEQSDKAQELARALGEGQQQRRSADAGLLANALQGRQAQPAGLDEDVAGNVTQNPGLPAQTPVQSLGQAIPMMGDPQMQQIALQTMAAHLPKRPEPFTLAPGAQRYDEGGKLIASAGPKTEPFSLAAGATRYGPDGKPIVTAPEKTTPEKPYYTPLQTGQGVMSFNARTGGMEPVQVGGAPVIGSASDPTLQRNLAGAKTEGKERAEAQVAGEIDLPRVTNNANNSLKLIDQMIGSEDGKTKEHPGFRTSVGMGFGPMTKRIPGTDAAGFHTLLDQVKGGAFLEAFNSLKGGGQITEVEGKKATDAITRMSTAQSESEFVRAAREYQQVIKTGVQRAQQKAVGSPYAGPERRGVPGGVDPALWNVMTPEERALWSQ